MPLLYWNGPLAKQSKEATFVLLIVKVDALKKSILEEFLQELDNMALGVLVCREDVPVLVHANANAAARKQCRRVGLANPFLITLTMDKSYDSLPLRRKMGEEKKVIEEIDIRHITCPKCKGRGEYWTVIYHGKNAREHRIESCCICEGRGWVHALFVDGEFVGVSDVIIGGAFGMANSIEDPAITILRRAKPMPDCSTGREQ
jgi:hypothetical protein